MKIALDCKSLLLKKALEKILKDRVVSKESAVMLITDKDKSESDLPLFRIGYFDNNVDLQKPFSRSQLMIKLEEKLKTIEQKDELISIVIEEDNTIDKEIEKLTKQFTSDLLKIFKKYHK